MFTNNGKPKRFTQWLLDKGLKPTLLVVWTLSLPLYLITGYMEHKASWQLVSYSDCVFNKCMTDIEIILDYKEKV